MSEPTTHCAGCTGVDYIGRSCRGTLSPRDARREAYAKVRAAVEPRVEYLMQPNREHVYGRGGIHADVSKCGSCGRLHAFRAVLAAIDTLMGDDDGR